MNSQTDIHTNTHIESRANISLTQRGTHNEYNQIGNGLLGSSNDVVGSINKKASKMNQDSSIQNTKSDMISHNDSIGFNNMMQNIQHITFENNVIGIKDDSSMPKKNTVHLKKKDESQLDLFEVPEVNRTARGNKKLSNQHSKNQIFNSDLSINSKYGHALRKNLIKSKKQNFKDYGVNTNSDKPLQELGSARLYAVANNTSKDLKDKQLMAPNKKKKRNKV